MNKKEFGEGIKILQNSYNQTFSQEKLVLWWNNLNKMSVETYLRNINHLVKTNHFLPSIAEVLNPRQSTSNFEQRSYDKLDFNKLYEN